MSLFVRRITFPDSTKSPISKLTGDTPCFLLWRSHAASFFVFATSETLLCMLSRVDCNSAMCCYCMAIRVCSVHEENCVPPGGWYSTLIGSCRGSLVKAVTGAIPPSRLVEAGLRLTYTKTVKLACIRSFVCARLGANA